MAEFKEIEEAMRLLIEQFNIAERRIKKAEQVRANEVVAAAIFELRYAGRKLVDALHILITGKWDPCDEDHLRVRTFIEDATEDCVKAKHDAIDATLDFVTTWFDHLETRLGLGRVVQFFPTYVETTGKIAVIQELVAESRGDRTKLRDAIYNQIETQGYDDVLGLFSNMKTSHQRIEEEFQRATAKERFLWWMAVGGFIVGVVGLVVGAGAWVFPKG